MLDLVFRILITGGLMLGAAHVAPTGARAASTGALANAPSEAPR